MSTANPTQLTLTTRFEPSHFRSHSRSPSRSPVRVAQFTAQELDPLLRDLSPDSTLQALTSTQAVSASGKRELDALERSIAEASPSERALGVRAAVAAQKLRQWHAEVSTWQWPKSKDNAAGKGFQPPSETGAPTQPGIYGGYMGSLPALLVKQYDDRIEEIGDGLEALDVEGLKEHVLDAHIPSRSNSTAGSALDRSFMELNSYGPLRDFTAVITATIVQALPYLARLTDLLEIWSIRITVLYDIPILIEELEVTAKAIQAALENVRNRRASPSSFTRSEYDTTRRSLQKSVSGLATRFDRILDLLEGREDSLPASWIDKMDDVENEFAEWVVESERRVLRHEWLERQQKAQVDARNVQPIPSSDAAPNMTQSAIPMTTGTQVQNKSITPIPPVESTNDALSAKELDQGFHLKALTQPPPPIPVARQTATDQAHGSLPRSGRDAVGDQPFQFPTHPPSAGAKPQNSKPTLNLTLPPSTHRREISEVSLAPSGYSEAFSDISNAEIVDATSTQVLASPTISVVDSPFRGNRDDLSASANGKKPRVQSMHFLGKDLETQDGGIDSSGRPRSMIVTRKALPNPKQDDLAMRPPLKSIVAEADDHEKGTTRPEVFPKALVTSFERVQNNQVRRVTVSQNNFGDFSPTTAQKPTPGAADGFEQTAASQRIAGEVSGHCAPPPRLPPNEMAGGEVNGNDDSHRRPPPPFDGLVSEQDSRNLGSESFTRQIPGEKHIHAEADLARVAELTVPDVSPPSTIDGSLVPSPSPISSPRLPVQKIAASPAKTDVETFESRIQDVLTALPTRIRLALRPMSPEISLEQRAGTPSRSSTPAPALTISPAKPERGSRNHSPIDSDVRVFNLVRSNQPDAPPTKLFVRLVGENGERVMVRVGGGWADLGEYLREYLSHHGKRAIDKGGFEVASLPSTSQKQRDVISLSPAESPAITAKTTTSGTNPSQAKVTSRPVSPVDYSNIGIPDASPNFGPLRASPQSSHLALSATRQAAGEATGTDEMELPKRQRPPPVPLVPRSPKADPAMTRPRTRGSSFTTTTTIIPADPRTHYQTQTQSIVTTTQPIISTTTTFFSPPTAPAPRFTPLGAAGPRGAIKNGKTRAVTFGSPPSQESEAWVEGLVGKVRQVSNPTEGGSKPVTGRTTPTPTAGRGAPPGSSPLAMSDPESAKSNRATTPTPEKGEAARPKSRLSGGGIKRVFLRSKKDAKKW